MNRSIHFHSSLNSNRHPKTHHYCKHTLCLSNVSKFQHHGWETEDNRPDYQSVFDWNVFHRTELSLRERELIFYWMENEGFSEHSLCKIDNLFSIPISIYPVYIAQYRLSIQGPQECSNEWPIELQSLKH